MHIGSVMGVKLYRHRELSAIRDFLRRGTEFAAEVRGRRTVRFPNPLPV